MKQSKLFVCGLLLILPLMFAGTLFGQNPNCTIIIPDAPLTARGLATPYRLKATNPTDGNGPCEETNSNSSAFVQAAILDPASGHISIYNPVVVSDDDPEPAEPTVAPTLPDHAIVAIWFGFNGNNLTQEGRHLKANGCVNGLPNNIFGQFSYCNAPAFFKAANQAISSGKLVVPPLGTANDGRTCPTVRDFYIVDQDQSDNLPVTYLISQGGRVAQNTHDNANDLPGNTLLGNPSDNGLLDRFVDLAIGCTPWKAPDLADPGSMVPALALNELQARAYQKAPVALIPAGDPMVLDAGTNAQDLAKVNAYRRGVDQPEASSLAQADTARYCRNMLRMAPARLVRDKAALLGWKSPVTTIGDSLFTFLTSRFSASYDILGCSDLVPIPDPISLDTTSGGVTIGAKINLPLLYRALKAYDPQDASSNAADADACKK